MALLQILTIGTAVLSVLAGWAGLFDSATEPVEVTQEGFCFAYGVFKGPMSLIHEAFLITAEKVGAERGVSKVGVGVYFDDPAVVESDKLRWWVGFQIPASQAEHMAKTQDIHTLCVPTSRVIHSEFPYRNMLSPMMGAMKVYPQFVKYVDEHEDAMFGTALELYESGEHDELTKLTYLIYQENNDIFKYVDEEAREPAREQ